jgi:hypothetical protein
MIKIDELFEKYPENIIGFRVNAGTKIIDFWLNNNWELLKLGDGINIKKQKTNEANTSTYYIIYSDMFDFGALFDMLSNIIEHNLDIEKKQVLFKDKLNELKEIQFETPYSLRQQDQPEPIELDDDKHEVDDLNDNLEDK